MNKELKPCPFCGGINASIENGGFSNRKQVICPDCGATATNSSTLRTEAIAAWNRRTEAKQMTGDQL